MIYPNDKYLAYCECNGGMESERLIFRTIDRAIEEIERYSRAITFKGRHYKWFIIDRETNKVLFTGCGSK